MREALQGVDAAEPRGQRTLWYGRSTHWAAQSYGAAALACFLCVGAPGVPWYARTARAFVSDVDARVGISGPTGAAGGNGDAASNEQP